MIIRNWEQYFESIVIPGIKIDEFITDIEKADDGYRNVLAGFYNTNENYIDIEDENKHIFKINDLTGDILNNNRVSFNAMIFQESELEEKIRENITLLSMQEFYSNLPNIINIYGIDIKPISFINKEDLEFTFNNTITKEEIIRIISQSSGLKEIKMDSIYGVKSNKKIMIKKFKLFEEDHLITKEEKLDYIKGMIEDIDEISDQMVDDIYNVIENYHSNELPTPEKYGDRDLPYGINGNVNLDGITVW